MAKAKCPAYADSGPLAMSAYDGAVAQHDIRTEHAGAKNGGGYWGRRADAKTISRVRRRMADKREERAARILPHPDGPFAQPPDLPAIPEYDEKGIGPHREPAADCPEPR